MWESMMDSWNDFKEGLEANVATSSARIAMENSFPFVPVERPRPTLFGLPLNRDGSIASGSGENAADDNSRRAEEDNSPSSSFVNEFARIGVGGAQLRQLRDSDTSFRAPELSAVWYNFSVLRTLLSYLITQL